MNNNRLYVFEAVQPVKLTPLKQWIARGSGGHYVIKRLKNADRILTPNAIGRLKQEAMRFSGKSYDMAFDWSDDKIYCSELIWKIYKRALGIEVGKLQKLKEFNLNNKLVKQKLAERYGNKLPLEQIVISPTAIFNSDLLMTVQ